MTPPVLVFGWGNRSRGDDALGPMFIERLTAWLEGPIASPALASAGRVECLEDYQLQIEHALDLAGRERVLFVDASLDGEAPFEVRELFPLRDASISTHAMSPQAVMQVFEELHRQSAPPCTLLAIRGERFDLGESASEAALGHLDQALQWAQAWIAAEVPCTS